MHIGILVVCNSAERSPARFFKALEHMMWRGRMLAWYRYSYGGADEESLFNNRGALLNLRTETLEYPYYGITIGPSGQTLFIQPDLLQHGREYHVTVCCTNSSSTEEAYEGLEQSMCDRIGTLSDNGISCWREFQCLVGGHPVLSHHLKAFWNELVPLELSTRRTRLVLHPRKKILKDHRSDQQTRITVAPGEKWMRGRCLHCWRRRVLLKYLPCGHRVMCGECNLISLDDNAGKLRCNKCTSEVERATAEWPIESRSCIVM